MSDCLGGREKNGVSTFERKHRDQIVELLVLLSFDTEVERTTFFRNVISPCNHFIAPAVYTCRLEPCSFSDFRPELLPL